MREKLGLCTAVVTGRRGGETARELRSDAPQGPLGADVFSRRRCSREDQPSRTIVCVAIIGLCRVERVVELADQRRGRWRERRRPLGLGILSAETEFRNDNILVLACLHEVSFASRRSDGVNSTASLSLRRIFGASRTSSCIFVQ